MKIALNALTTEGFTQHILLQLDNGLELINRDRLAWRTTDQKQKVLEQVRELLQNLKSAGFQVENEDLLDQL